MSSKGDIALSSRSFALLVGLAAAGVTVRRTAIARSLKHEICFTITPLVPWDMQRSGSPLLFATVRYLYERLTLEPLEK
jgi:hypothetical protein